MTNLFSSEILWPKIWIYSNPKDKYIAYIYIIQSVSKLTPSAHTYEWKNL